MSELQHIIEDLYKKAKSGQWNQLLAEWENSDVLAKRCSRYIKPGSSWSFLHQAACFGNEQACRALISLGASLEARTHDDLTAADIAKQKGHHKLASFLLGESSGSLHRPPVDPDVRASSSKWAEAKKSLATTDLFVAYGGGLVRIPKGSQFFTDSLNRILIGWHGTFNPPRGMDGNSMIPRVE